MLHHTPSQRELNAQATEPIKQQGRDCCSAGGYYNDNPWPTETLNHRLWNLGMDEQRELEAKVRASQKRRLDSRRGKI